MYILEFKSGTKIKISLDDFIYISNSMLNSLSGAIVLYDGKVPLLFFNKEDVLSIYSKENIL